MKKIGTIIIFICLIFNPLYSQKNGFTLDTIAVSDLNKNEVVYLIEFNKKPSASSIKEKKVQKESTIRYIEPTYQEINDTLELTDFIISEKGRQMSNIVYKPARYELRYYAQVMLSEEKEYRPIQAIGLKKYMVGPSHKLIPILAHMKLSGHEDKYVVKRLQQISPMKVVIEYPKSKKATGFTLKELDPSTFKIGQNIQFEMIEKALDSLGYEVVINGELDALDKKALSNFQRENGIGIHCGPGGEIEVIRKRLQIPYDDFYDVKLLLNTRTK